MPALATPLALGLLLLGVAAVASSRLVMMVVPVLVLLREPGGLLRRPSIILLGLLFVPKGLPVLYGEVNIGVVVNALLLVALVVGLSLTAIWQKPRRAVSAGNAEPLLRGRAETSDVATEG